VDYHTKKFDTFITMDNVGLVSVHGQLKFPFQEARCPTLGIYRRTLGSSQDQNVIRIANDAMLPTHHKLVKSIQIDVCNQRADDSALRTSQLRGLPILPYHNPAIQKQPHQL
jgi:hypothetical protein